MTARGDLGRRRFVTAIGVSCAALGLRLWSPSLRSVPVPERAMIARMIRALFGDLAAARRIGRAYLAGAGPDEQRPEQLLEAIAAARSGDFVGSSIIPAIALHYRRWVRLDFVEAAVVNVDGWILCRTEARLCALAALVA